MVLLPRRGHHGKRSSPTRRSNVCLSSSIPSCLWSSDFEMPVGGADFARDDIVYILNNLDPPDLPKSDTSEEEELEWDKENLYFGKIVEARDESGDEVFILVAYLYWPDEILLQQKKTHNFYGKEYARGELIMSNHLQVIDATSISRKEDISYW